ncbi:hypothetical protein OKW26_000499 [Paraburkholderia sp. 32]
MADTTRQIDAPGLWVEAVAQANKRHRRVYKPLMCANHLGRLLQELLSIERFFLSKNRQQVGFVPFPQFGPSFICRLKLRALLWCLHFDLHDCVRGSLA